MKKQSCEELEKRILELEKEVDELKEIKRIFDLFMEYNPVYTFFKDKDLRSIKLSRNYEQMLGRPIDEILGKTMDKIFPPDLAESMIADDRRILEKRKPIKVEEELDGRFYETVKFPIIINDKPKYLAGYTMDITERKQTETKLMQSLMKFEKTFQAAPVWVSLSTVDDGRLIEVNEAFLNDIGYKREEVIGRTCLELNTWIDPIIREIIISKIKREGGIRNFDVQRRTKKGDVIDTLFSAELLTLEDQQVMISVIQNITVLKQVHKDRDYLTEQLAHVQKMESIGRLAGGVAHDFNNMLTVITGNSEIALSKADASSPLYENLQDILNAAERSANITKQLLAFARKQTIEPRILDINNTLEGMLKMLRSMIGEDIELIWNPDRNIWPVKIDPAQIDQILVNLCINSRDAVKYLGKIIIRTENIAVDEAFSSQYTGLKPGDYVLLTFSDDGEGMDKDVLEKIFEPFFTTKSVGKGTGLGLSTVYGIVKQNKGYIYVDSAPDEGTIFKIYFPRHKSDRVDADNNRVESKTEAQGETILVVEDNDLVRDVTEMLLKELDYNVLSTGDPSEAIRIIKECPEKIHLIVSDVVMPGMSGRDMAKKITNILPDIKILFMSGYNSDSIVHDSVLYEGLNFLKKPFTTSKLALKVREVLDKQ